MKDEARVLTQDEIDRKYSGLKTQENFITYHALDLGYQIACVKGEKIHPATNLDEKVTNILQKKYKHDKVIFIYFTDTRQAIDGVVYFAFTTEPK